MIINQQDSWNKINREIYITNVNSVMLLFEKIADITLQYFPNERSAILTLWKIVCEHVPSGDIYFRVALKIKNLEPNYVIPPRKKVPAVRNLFVRLLIDAIIIIVGVACFGFLMAWMCN